MPVFTPSGESRRSPRTSPRCPVPAVVGRATTGSRGPGGGLRLSDRLVDVVQSRRHAWRRARRSSRCRSSEPPPMPTNPSQPPVVSAPRWRRARTPRSARSALDRRRRSRSRARRSRPAHARRPRGTTSGSATSSARRTPSRGRGDARLAELPGPNTIGALDAKNVVSSSPAPAPPRSASGEAERARSARRTPSCGRAPRGSCRRAASGRDLARRLGRGEERRGRVERRSRKPSRRRSPRL